MKDRYVNMDISFILINLRKYVVMYVNEYEVDDILQKLMKLKYVLHIDGSPYKNLKKTYDKEKHEKL